jgi:hypothetical protein
MEQLEWAATVTVNVGAFLVGIRTSSPVLTELLTTGLESQLRSTTMAPAYYSLKVGTPSRRRATPMHYLYVGGHVVFGSRDLKRTVDALLGRLNMHALTASSDVMCVRGVPVMAAGRLLLAPPELLPNPASIERELFSRGLAVGTTEYVAIGADGLLRLPPHTLEVRDEAVSSSQLGQVAAVDIEASLPVAPWRLDRWLVETDDGSAGVFDPAHALLHGARQLRLPLPIDAQQALEQIGAVISAATVRGVSWQTPEELCDLVATAVAE